MFELNPRSKVELSDTTIVGTVHVDSLLISSMIDKESGLTMRVLENMYPEDGEFDVEIPISMTLSQNGDLHYHSVAANYSGWVNIKKDPDGWSNVVLDGFNERMIHKYINANLDGVKEMTQDEVLDAAAEYLFTLLKPSDRAKQMLLATIGR